jgi:hypothetical protein
MAIWGVGGLMLCAILHPSGLVPRLLSVWAVAGYLVFVAAKVLEILGYSAGVLLSAPSGLFEIALSLWLIVKGFRSPVLTAGRGGQPAALGQGLDQAVTAQRPLLRGAGSWRSCQSLTSTHQPSRRRKRTTTAPIAALSRKDAPMTYPEAVVPQSYARTAGILYLIIAAFGAFSIAYVPSVIVAAGDPATTAANLIAHRTLFGMGALADVVVMLTEIVLAVMLFVIFRPVSPTLSLIAMVSRLAMVLVMAVNLLIHVTPVVVLSGAGYLSAFSPDQLQAAAMILFEVHQLGIYVWDMFFGFHLLVLGVLIIRSGHFPKLLGGAVLVGSAGYFLEGLVKVTFIENGTVGTAIIVLLVVASISELVFAFWLLIKGFTPAAWNRTLAAQATA